jgi:hypothetical protein
MASKSVTNLASSGGQHSPLERSLACKMSRFGRRVKSDASGSGTSVLRECGTGLGCRSPVATYQGWMLEQRKYGGRTPDHRSTSCTCILFSCVRINRNTQLSICSCFHTRFRVPISPIGHSFFCSLSAVKCGGQFLTPLLRVMRG